jgi:hypothetical protein
MMRKKMQVFAGILTLVFCLMSGDGIAEEQELIFSDDFEKGKVSDVWKIDSPHSWKIEDGILTTTKYGGGASINKDLPEEIVVECKVKPVELNPELSGGFGGLAVSNINFVVRKDGFWWPYKKPGAERYSGGFKKKDVILERWYHFKVIRHSGGIFEWYVDGEKVCEIVESVMKGGVGFHAWRMKMAYDNFSVYALPVKKSSDTFRINLIRNSSFDTVQDNLPLYWSPRGFGIPSDGRLEDFVKMWQIDKGERYHGVNSLKIEKGGVHSWYFSIEKGKPYVFSVYLKSDTEDLPVTLFLWEWNIGKFHKKEVRVGKGWNRYEVLIDNTTTGHLRVGVDKTGDGVLWVDAAQLEEGKEPTTYALNSLDVKEKTEKAKIVFPETRPVKVPVPPVIDGNLNDSAWKKASQSPPFLVSTVAGERMQPKEKTESYLCYDDENLYIAFRCYDSQMDKLKATVKEDNGPVWSDDCVEMFIDKNLNRRTYYHFAINPLGTRYVQDKVDNLPFGRRWAVKTEIQKDSWTVEIAIPFSTLGIDSFTGQRWGINLGRENHKTNEYSCTSPVSHMNFHDVGNYGILYWPEKDVFARYLYELRELSLKPAAGKKGYTLTGIIRNSTDADTEVEIEAEVSGRKETSPTISIKKGEEQKFIFGSFPPAEESSFLGKIVVSKSPDRKILLEKNLQVNVSPVIESLFTLSYYTTEEKAELLTRFNLEEKDLKGSRVVLTVKDDDKTLKQIDHPVLKKEQIIPVPIKDLREGNYKVTLSLRRARDEVAVSEQMLKKLKPAGNEVKIDTVNRALLVDGKPFFTFAPLVSFWFAYPHLAYKEGWEGKMEEVISYWAEEGFRSLIVISRIFPLEVTEKGWKKLFELAGKYNIKVVAWPGFKPKEGLEKHFEQFIEKFKGESALLVWCVADEPEIQKEITPEEIVEVVKRTKEADPYHPVYLNFTPIGPTQRYAGLPGDIISTDLYITGGEGRPIRAVVDIVELKEKIAEEKRMLTWMWLVGNNLYNHFREPTAEEQEAQTYGAVIAGCTGLKYFYGQPYGYKHWVKMKQLNQELNTLTPVISSEKLPGIKSNHPDILVMGRRYKDIIYLFSVNINGEEKIEGKIDLSAYLGNNTARGKVLFEKREVDIKGGILKDVFAPFHRNVYEIAAR